MVVNTDLHALQDDGLLLVAQRLSSDHILQASHSNDVPCARDIDVLSAVGMHEQQAADALAAALVAVQRKCALRHRATAATDQASQGMWLPTGGTLDEGICGLRSESALRTKKRPAHGCLCPNPGSNWGPCACEAHVITNYTIWTEAMRPFFP